MAPLTLIWTVSLVMAAGALAWMSGLIVLRLVHQRGAVRDLADRQSVQAALLDALQGGGDVGAALAPYQADGHLMAVTLLDFVGLLHGPDLETVVETLRQAGVEKVLCEGVDSGVGPERLACIEALGAFGTPKTLTVLWQAASAGTPTTRLAALRSLLQAGAGVSIAEIVSRLGMNDLPQGGSTADLVRMIVETDPEGAIAALEGEDELPPNTQSMLLVGLGATGSYAALPTIIAQLQAGDARVRASAAVALGLLRHPAAEDSLREAMSDPVSFVRSAAAEAIGSAGLDRLTPALESGLNDAAWSVRFEAAAALAKFDPPQVGADAPQQPAVA